MALAGGPRLDDDVVTVQGTVIGDPDPTYDDCANSKAGLARHDGRNVGDLLTAKGITWGWFQGGFTPTGQQGRQGRLRLSQ